MSSGGDDSPEEVGPHRQSLMTSASAQEYQHTLTPAPPTLYPNDPSETIDIDTFLHILNLDEEDNHGVNSGMAWFEYAAGHGQSVASPTCCVVTPVLTSISTPPSFPVSADSPLGHFLKGSSAALGVHKMPRSCDQI
ncbi:hypothetical protein JB92DRAFT_3108960 [Gautieria morchelliformis]|nr:hypothetical protein JB92DRAFT_3108960 [Gautieria morchelliformis]